MLLPNEKTRPSASMENQVILLYGQSKIGKSTLASQFPGAIFASTEPGLKYLEAYQVEVNNWDTFIKMCSELEKEEHDFKTVVIDTIDLLYSFLTKKISRSAGVDDISDMKSFSKGYRMANEGLHNTLAKLTNMTTKRGHKMGLIMISHITQREDEGRVLWAPTLSPSPTKRMQGMADIICCADVYRGEGGKVERILRLSSHPKFFGLGGRVPTLPEVTKLNYKDFEETVMKSIKELNNV